MALQKGYSKTRTYQSWVNMRRRCRSFDDRDFKHYQGRGIGVCERWADSFDNFLADMGERPPGTSLDRIDNAKGYEPGNCRWATAVEQARNRRPEALYLFSIAEVADMVQMRSDGASLRKIAAKYSSNPMTVSFVLARAKTDVELQAALEQYKADPTVSVPTTRGKEN